jgi:hypothetical protein
VTRRKLCSVERCSVLLNPSNIMRLCWSVFVFRTPSDAVVHHSLNTPTASAPSLPGNYKHPPSQNTPTTSSPYKVKYYLFWYYFIIPSGFRHCW